MFCPTANYVNYYGMANGLPIPDCTKADAESGYTRVIPGKTAIPVFIMTSYMMACNAFRGLAPHVKSTVMPIFIRMEVIGMIIRVAGQDI